MKVIVTVNLSNDGKVHLAEGRKIADLNPKELFLCSAAECAALTLHGILKKEQIKPKSIELELSGILDTDTVMARSVYTSFNICYRIECNTISEQAKIGRAVRLTTDKYCGLFQMLRRIAPLSHEIEIVSVETVEA
ncbi:MAG: OsmC family protein [Alistipes sp.]|jgi:putative redox protein|nr:OsmC family protein [Alistipes sp.]